MAKTPLSNLEEIYWMLADKYKLRKEVVENIVQCQFRFVHDIIRNSDLLKPESFKSISITHLGKYLPRKKRIKEFRERKLKSLEYESGTQNTV